MAIRVVPVVSVAEHLKPERLFTLFLEHRRQLQMDIIDLASDHVGRQLTQRLEENRIVALVADRDLSGGGIEVEMFGRTRRMPAGPALIALSSGAPSSRVRPSRRGTKVEVLSEVTIEPTGRGKDDIVTLTRAGRLVREGDRLRALGLAPVPARLGRAGAVRIALVCPYDWQSAGACRCTREPRGPAPERGHEAVVLAPTGAVPTDPWVRSVGHPPVSHVRSPDCAARAGRTRAVLASVARRPRPRAAHAEYVHVRDDRVAGAGRGDGARLPRPLAGDGARAPVLRRVWSRVSIGAVSHAAATFLRRAVPRAELEIVPNGVDVRAFADAEPRRPADRLGAPVGSSEGVLRRRRRVRQGGPGRGPRRRPPGGGGRA